MLPKTLFVANKTNIRYLSGFSGTAGYLALRGKKGFLFTDARYHLVAKSVLPKTFEIIDNSDGFGKPWKEFLKKHHIKKIGVEGATISLKLWKWLKKNSAGAELIDIENTLDKRRMVKKQIEIEKIEKAQYITDRILTTLKQRLKSGLSEEQIAWHIEVLAREYGAEDISFPPIIAFNENSASPHHHVTERKLKRGDMILIDMGVIYKGYCSDMTRVLFTKDPTEEQKKVYELVLKAQKTAIQKLRPGVSGKQADSFARTVIKKAGYSQYFGHSLGHGVGLDIHELPNLSQKYKEKIPFGSVVTVEPGVYLPGKFGVRLEDMLVIEKSRARNLTKSQKSIQEAIIRLK